MVIYSEPNAGQFEKFPADAMHVNMASGTTPLVPFVVEQPTGYYTDPSVLLAPYGWNSENLPVSLTHMTFIDCGPDKFLSELSNVKDFYNIEMGSMVEAFTGFSYIPICREGYYFSPAKEIQTRIKGTAFAWGTRQMLGLWPVFRKKNVENGSEESVGEMSVFTGERIDLGFITPSSTGSQVDYDVDLMITTKVLRGTVFNAIMDYGLVGYIFGSSLGISHDSSSGVNVCGFKKIDSCISSGSVSGRYGYRDQHKTVLLSNFEETAVKPFSDLNINPMFDIDLKKFEQL